LLEAAELPPEITDVGTVLEVRLILESILVLMNVTAEGIN